MSYVANARMYSVNPGAASAWKELFEWLARESGVDLRVIDHTFPAPLADLWSRPDLGCAFMCGFPYMLAKASAAAGRGAGPAGRAGAGKAALCDAARREGRFRVSFAGRHVWRPARLYGRGLPFRLQRVAASSAAVSAAARRQPLSREHRTADHAAAGDRGASGRRYRCRAARQLCAGSDAASRSRSGSADQDRRDDGCRANSVSGREPGMSR